MMAAGGLIAALGFASGGAIARPRGRPAGLGMIGMRSITWPACSAWGWGWRSWWWSCRRSSAGCRSWSACRSREWDRRPCPGSPAGSWSGGCSGRRPPGSSWARASSRWPAPCCRSIACQYVSLAAGGDRQRGAGDGGRLRGRGACPAGWGCARACSCRPWPRRSGTDLAVVAALALRLVWVAAELLAAAVLLPLGPWYRTGLGRSRRKRGRSRHDQRRHPGPQRGREPGRASRRARGRLRRQAARGRSSSSSSTTAAATARGTVLAELAARDPRVRAIRFRRNFGKAAALDGRVPGGAGRSRLHARRRPPGRPGRDPPLPGPARRGVRRGQRLEEDPPRPLAQGLPQPGLQLDGQPPDRLPPARPQLRLQALPPEVLREVDIYGELHRFVPVLAHARGFRVGEIEVHHRPRRHGASKYGVSRFLKGFLDLLTVRFLTRFRQRPLHVLGGMGLVLLSLGSLGLLYLAVLWLLDRIPADRQSPAALLLDRAPGRRRAAPEPGHPRRAGHGVQHPARRYVQHRRDHREARRGIRKPGVTRPENPPGQGAPYPTTRGRCVDTADTGFDARK